MLENRKKKKCLLYRLLNIFFIEKPEDRGQMI